MNAKVAPQGSPDEQPHGDYKIKVVCKYPTGPGRKQCGSDRYVKPQDVHQVRYCKAHAKRAAYDVRAKRAKEKRAAAKASS
jgi:hypothetical protein